MSIGSRRVGISPAPAGLISRGCCSRCATRLLELNDREQEVRFLIDDRDAQSPGAFDAVLASGNIGVIRTPVRVVG